MGKKIIITAGHGNGDPGAIYNGEREAELALWLRDEVANQLRLRGCEVIEDGADAENQGLRDAIALLKENPGVEAYEIHFNASANPNVRGVEVLAPANARYAAQAVALGIANTLKTNLRGEAGWKPSNGGQHHRLGYCEAGGCVVEVEFITNPEALKNYLARRAVVAQAIAAVLAV